MSLFKKVFGEASTGRKKGAKNNGKTGVTDSTINAIENLTLKEEQLEKRREILEQRITKELGKAKEYQKKNNKAQALTCLKRKKLYEEQINNLANLILKLNEQKIMLENSQTSAETIHVMKAANEASKTVMKANKIENVEEVMDDIENMQDDMKDVMDRLNAPIGIMKDIDEDDLIQELEDLEAQGLEEELLEPIDTTPHLTKKEEGHKVAVKSEPKAKEKVHDDNEINKELKELEAELDAA